MAYDSFINLKNQDHELWRRIIDNDQVGDRVESSVGDRNQDVSRTVTENVDLPADGFRNRGLHSGTNLVERSTNRSGTDVTRSAGGENTQRGKGSVKQIQPTVSDINEPVSSVGNRGQSGVDIQAVGQSSNEEADSGRSLNGGDLARADATTSSRSRSQGNMPERSGNATVARKTGVDAGVGDAETERGYENKDKAVLQGATVLADRADAKSRFGENNTIVSADRIEELRRRAKEKLSQLNSGFDTELFTKLHLLHIKNS